MGCSMSNDASDSKNSNCMMICVNGGPGAGKGTQCERLAEAYGFNHMSTGDLLRKEVQSGGALAGEIQKIQSEGGLVSSELVVNLIKNKMKECHFQGVFLVDGFPRNQENVDTWKKVMKREPDCLLYFECSQAVMEERMIERSKTSGRSDDNPETIKKRIEVFNEQTRPVVDYYEQKGLLNKVDADRGVEDIFTDLRFYVESKKLPEKQNKANEFMMQKQQQGEQKQKETEQQEQKEPEQQEQKEPEQQEQKEPEQQEQNEPEEE